MKIIVLTLLLASLSACATHSANRSFSSETDRANVESIFDVFDQQMSGSDEYLNYIEEDVILLAHNVPEINGRENYIQHIQDNRSYGTTEIEHQLIELSSYAEVVIARGKAVGSFQANNAAEKITFETKNMFVFKRLDNGELSVWQIIFNMNP